MKVAAAVLLALEAGACASTRPAPRTPPPSPLIHGFPPEQLVAESSRAPRPAGR